VALVLNSNPPRSIADVALELGLNRETLRSLREANYPPVQYIPLDDVDPTLLAASDTQTYCPYKGDASYCSITLPQGQDGEGQLVDAVWSYREPYQAVAPIAGHVAFYATKAEIAVEAA
jgi:uncharacterized protein (DUF427 family)